MTLYCRDTVSTEECHQAEEADPVCWRPSSPVSRPYQARRTRSHPPKWTIKAEDPDLLIPIELSQSRADSDLNQDLGGDLSVVSPRESHQSEETLPTVPLGQFQAQRSDNTTTESIAHFQSETPSQKRNKQYNNQKYCRKYCNFPDHNTLPKRNILRDRDWYQLQ